MTRASGLPIATRTSALVLAAVWATGGCSAIFVQKASGVPAAGQPVTCTDSRVAPWIDTYVVALSLAGAVAIGLQPCPKEEFGCIGKLAILPLAGFVLGYAPSAIWGHAAVNECRELRARPPGAGASAPPVATVGSPVTVTWRVAAVSAAFVEVHTAPFLAAPTLVRAAPGTRLSVSSEVTNGWRLAALPDGRVGYVQDAQVRVE